MRTPLCLVVLPVLAFAMKAEAREHSSGIPPVSNPPAGQDIATTESTFDLLRSHPLVFNAGDAQAALSQAFAKRRQGRVAFSLRGAGIDRDITADCDVTAGRGAGDAALAEPPPSAITCRFHEAGRTLPARLALRGTGGSGPASAGQYGELRIDGLAVRIAGRAGKGDDGAAVPAAGGPSGYVFSVDGVVVGSVELAGRPVVRFVPGHDSRTSRAVMLAATALGVLWSPQAGQPARLADR